MNIEELTKKINEQVNQEIENRLREAMVNLTSESIVQRLEDLIRENERLKANQNNTWTPFISIPNVTYCNHEYSNPWFGTTPPACKKCGQIVDFTITCNANLKEDEWYIVPSSSTIKV